MDKKEGEKNILVFDLGGETFNVSLLAIDSGVFEVVATNGDTHLGKLEAFWPYYITFSSGEDFDQHVVEHFIKLYKKTGQEICKSNRTVGREAKRTLSTQHQVKIEIESFYEGEDFLETSLFQKNSTW